MKTSNPLFAPGGTVMCTGLFVRARARLPRSSLSSMLVENILQDQSAKHF